MPIPAVSVRRPVTATARQSLAATTYLDVLPQTVGRMAGTTRLPRPPRFTPGRLPSALLGVPDRARLAETVRRAEPALPTVLLCDRLRREHRGAPVWLRVGGRPMLLAIHRDDVRAVLDGTPAPIATEPPISHGRHRSRAIVPGHRTWRTTADTVLRVVAADPRTADVAGRHTARLVADGRGAVRPADWRRLHHRVIRQLVLGDSATDDETLTTRQRALHGDLLTARVAAHLDRAAPGSVSGLLRDGSRAAAPAAAPLVGLLATIADTLAEHTFRALQLLSVRPPACTGRWYLSACLREAARLWPSTAVVIRETVRDTEWGGAGVPAGTRVLIVNSFGHRDRRRIPFADDFVPGEWLHGGHAVREPLFNGFGHTRQHDPAQTMAVACGAAILSTVMESADLVPDRSVFQPDGRIRTAAPPVRPLHLRV